MALIWCLLAGKLYGLSPRELSIAFCAEIYDKESNSKIQALFNAGGEVCFFVFVLKKRKGFLPSCRLFCFAKLFEMRFSYSLFVSTLREGALSFSGLSCPV